LDTGVRWRRCPYILSTPWGGKRNLFGASKRAPSGGSEKRSAGLPMSIGCERGKGSPKENKRYRGLQKKEGLERVPAGAYLGGTRTRTREKGSLKTGKNKQKQKNETMTVGNAHGGGGGTVRGGKKKPSHPRGQEPNHSEISRKESKKKTRVVVEHTGLQTIHAPDLNQKPKVLMNILKRVQGNNRKKERASHIRRMGKSWFKSPSRG